MFIAKTEDLLNTYESIFNYMQDFLDDGGTELGYSSYDMPNLEDMSTILEHNVKVWEYHVISEE